MMLIKNARFITSFSDYKSYLADLEHEAPEICVVGRSNVGKSSVINMLAGMKNLAKTSSTPGRTRLINLFDFNNGQFLLVDLPGYGYAKVIRSEKEKWGSLIEGYLTGSTKLRHVFMLVDCRHDPSEKDIQMAQYLYFNQLPFSIIATKADKLSKAGLSRSVMQIAAGLKVGRDDILPVSAVSKLNREKLVEKIEIIIDNKLL